MAPSKIKQRLLTAIFLLIFTGIVFLPIFFTYESMYVFKPKEQPIYTTLYETWMYILLMIMMAFTFAGLYKMSYKLSNWFLS